MSAMVTAGLDIGSTTTKVALLADGQVVATRLAATGANCRRAALGLLGEALAEAGLGESDVRYVVSTGYGRRIVEVADEAVSEITANAVGAQWCVRQGPLVRTIVDIGGQDSKVISLDEHGHMVNFAMNDKCAAGTGRFLEVMARILEVDLEQLGSLGVQAKETLAISSLCTVFAESEVISLLAQGKAVPDIVAALHASIARRVGALARSVGVVETVFFDGGPALNRGLKDALEQELAVFLHVPPEPQTVTAVGAAVIAGRRVEGGAHGAPLALSVAERA